MTGQTSEKKKKTLLRDKAVLCPEIHTHTKKPAPSNDCMNNWKPPQTTQPRQVQTNDVNTIARRSMTCEVHIHHDDKNVYVIIFKLFPNIFYDFFYFQIFSTIFSIIFQYVLSFVCGFCSPSISSIFKFINFPGVWPFPAERASEMMEAKGVELPK